DQISLGEKGPRLKVVELDLRKPRAVAPAPSIPEPAEHPDESTSSAGPAVPDPAPAAAADLPGWYVGDTELPVIFAGHRLLQEFEGGMARVFRAEPVEGGAAVAL